MPRWTDYELGRLRALYPMHANREIAGLLGRTPASVARQGLRLGLHKTELRRVIVGVQNTARRYGTA